MSEYVMIHIARSEEGSEFAQSAVLLRLTNS